MFVKSTAPVIELSRVATYPHTDRLPPPPTGC